MKIPDRWLEYSALGKCIAGTRFICFKVPLKDALCRNLEVHERFTPKMLIEQCPKLGLVIDLTNTNRYYSGETFVSKGIQYKKLFCPGHMIPPEKLVQEFFDTVDGFLDESREEDKLIGVHCTHGLNRTGYFICRYLSLRMGFTPKEAISAFEDARGYKIERQPYIEDIVAGKEISSKPKVPDSSNEHLQQNNQNHYSNEHLQQNNQNHYSNEHLQQNNQNHYENRIEENYGQNGVEVFYPYQYQSPLAGCSYDNYAAPNRYSRFQPRGSYNHYRNSPYDRPVRGHYGNRKWERNGDRGRGHTRKM